MNEEFMEQLKQEGYGVWAVDGQWLLVDLLGEFIDSQHDSEQSVRDYCDKNVFTYLD
jgi:hypothetical protein